MRLRRHRRPGPRVESTADSLLTFRPFQAAAALGLAAGLVGGERTLILLCALVLATVNLARLWCRCGCRRLVLQATLSCNRLFPGETFELAVEAENRQLLPMWVRAVVPAPDGHPPGGGPAEPPEPLLAGESGLTAFQRARWRRTLPAGGRGVYRLGPLRLEAGDLLGFFRRRQENPVCLEILVYPRRIALAPLPLPMRELFGLRRGRPPVDDPACLAGSRDYRGDRPARHIHWKTSARLDRLQEKVFEPTAQNRLLILLDAADFAAPEGSDGRTEVRPDGAEPFERALEVVASLILELDRARVPVGLAANGVLRGGRPAVLAPGRGPGHLVRLLETLARLTPVPAGGEPGRPFGPGLPLSGATSCLYVCRCPDGRAGETIRRLRCRPRSTLVVVAAEQGKMPAGDPAVLLSELRRHG